MAPPFFTGPPTILKRGSFTEHTYHGSCHCGKVAFTFIGPPPEEIIMTTCNCTFCTKRATASAYTTDESLFTWTKGSFDDLTEYKFNTGNVKHYFCPTCGISVASTATGGVIAVGLRCIDEQVLDLDELKRQHFDGLNLLPRVDNPQTSQDVSQQNL